MHLLSIEYIKTTKRTLVGFHPNYTTNFNAKYSSFHLWQLDLTILTAQISRSSVERTDVCGCQSAFIALIASNSNSKHKRKTLTDFGLTGTSLRHLDRHFNFVGREEKKLHAIVRSRTVTWLTRWRLPQWSQLNSGIFFLNNATRKHATMLDGTNRIICLCQKMGQKTDTPWCFPLRPDQHLVSLRWIPSISWPLVFRAVSVHLKKKLLQGFISILKDIFVLVNFGHAQLIFAASCPVIGQVVSVHL